MQMQHLCVEKTNQKTASNPDSRQKSEHSQPRESHCFLTGELKLTAIHKGDARSANFTI